MPTYLEQRRQGQQGTLDALDTHLTYQVAKMSSLYSRLFQQGERYFSSTVRQRDWTLY